MSLAEVPLQPAMMTMDEYLRTPFRPDCDFVEGHLEERNGGEYKQGLLQMEVGFWFRSRRAEWNVRVVGELRTHVSADRIRIPDVTVVYDDAATAERVRVTPPLIAIEILSPEDRLPRVLVRREDFRKMGIAHIWLLDPEERAAFVYTDNGLKRVETSRMEVADADLYGPGRSLCRSRVGRNLPYLSGGSRAERGGRYICARMSGRYRKTSW